MIDSKKILCDKFIKLPFFFTNQELLRMIGKEEIKYFNKLSMDTKCLLCSDQISDDKYYEYYDTKANVRNFVHIVCKDRLPYTDWKIVDKLDEYISDLNHHSIKCPYCSNLLSLQNNHRSCLVTYRKEIWKKANQKLNNISPKTISVERREDLKYVKNNIINNKLFYSKWDDRFIRSIKLFLKDDNDDDLSDKLLNNVMVTY